MDARLVRKLPAALGLEDGEVVHISNAGGRLTDPYGETMRSILIAIYELGVEDIMFIGHTDCGAQNISTEEMIRHMRGRGITDEDFEKVMGETLIEDWLSGFCCSKCSVESSVTLLREHPLVPQDVTVHGFVIDVVTGELSRVDDDRCMDGTSE